MSPTRLNEWPPHDVGSFAALNPEEEREARRIHDEIERRIELDRQEMKKRRPHAKLLLLGPAEAGKSTLLKNFQLHFSPKAFQGEAEAWRAVVHLNLARVVNFVVEAVASSTPSRTPSVGGRSQSSLSQSSARIPADHLRALRMRLSPLRQVELILHRRICGENPSSSPSSPTMSSNGELPPGNGTASPDTSVRARPGWKVLHTVKQPTSSVSDDLQDSRQIIDACKEDIVALWSDAAVRALMREEYPDLDDYHTYFLENAGRIAAQRYTPNADDILRVRVQTIGVEEHRLVLEIEKPGHEWIFYDVEGRRGLKAWAPFFDDVNAMFFLCPMAHFDQYAPEDDSVNCLLDTFSVWKHICESKLLAEASFILFLNKMDLLKTKLKSGIKFSKYVTLYKDQPNDAENVSHYLKRKFTSVHKHSAPKPRPLHIHITCAVDTKFMANILVRVQDVIFLASLKSTSIIS